jgi:hypothetical protein
MNHTASGGDCPRASGRRCSRFPAHTESPVPAGGHPSEASGPPVHHPSITSPPGAMLPDRPTPVSGHSDTPGGTTDVGTPAPGSQFGDAATSRPSSLDSSRPIGELATLGGSGLVPMSERTTPDRRGIRPHCRMHPSTGPGTPTGRPT